MNAHQPPCSGSYQSRDARRRLSLCVFCLLAQTVVAGNLAGYLRDPNWYARYRANPPGVGYYEFAVNANGAGLATTGGADDTDVYGYFLMSNLAAGSYTVASWDVWWRSAYAFNVPVPGSGNSPVVDLRLGATMWGYPAFWEDAGFYEFGQTFVATGPISMIYLRCPYSTTYRLTVHQGAPGGAQVGVARTFTGGDQRPIYGYGEMPTLAGQPYYLRVRTASPSIGGVIMRMDPRPDYSDPMPGGCLWLGNGTTLTAHPDQDLGVVIMSDDDGLVTDLFARASGATIADATSVGQSFVARGVALISAAFWLADPAAPVYVVTLREGGPGGPPVGPSKKGRPARLGADPEMIVTWAPEECPLTVGQVYYLEVTKNGGGTFYQAYVNRSDPFASGQAYRDGTPLSQVDLAGTIMEAAAPGSAARPRVRILSGPNVEESERGTNHLVVRWTTDVPSDSQVAYAADTPPYTASERQADLVTDHAVALPALRSHALYHCQVRSTAAGYAPGVSRDVALCTRPRLANLLVNPGFEAGTGPSPQRTVPGWSWSGGVDIAASDGTWFWGLPPHSGRWLLEGAVNGSSADAALSQRVSVTQGKEYTFSAWVTTWMRENDTFKYDVWNARDRLSYMRLGIDPTGGTNPGATTVQWTPRFYSHLRYSNPAKTVRALGNSLTVFVSMKGSGGQWHLYGVDDCVLTEKEAEPPRLSAPQMRPEGGFAFTITGDSSRLHRIEASPDFRTWETLTNWVPTNRVWQFLSPLGPPHSRFYRAVAP